eukprot:m.94473 g.94473  ORF g.94473 m.94473 type:complete len:52 (-) comp10049_c0_seq4:1183-1338(-)
MVSCCLRYVANVNLRASQSHEGIGTFFSECVQINGCTLVSVGLCASLCVHM